MLVQQQLAHMPAPSAHKAVDMIGDTIGYGPLLVIIVLGALGMFRKRIQRWLRD